MTSSPLMPGLGRCLGRAGVIVVALCFLAVFVSAASAATEPAPGWTIDSVASPTDFAARDNAECLSQIVATFEKPFCDSYQVDVRNSGEKAMDGGPVTITDTLPRGITVQQVDLFSSEFPGTNLAPLTSFVSCSTAPSAVTCELTSSVVSTLRPEASLQMIIYVTVDEPEAVGGVSNLAAVAGAGASRAEISRSNEISSAPPSFALAGFAFDIAGPDGAPDIRAGDHPYELTTTIDLNSMIQDDREETNVIASVHDVKDVVVDLPLGFAGSALAAPECTLAQFTSPLHCPPETAIGNINTEPESVEAVHSAIWNLTPERGVPAEFGYVDDDKNTHVFYSRVAPTPEGYVLQVSSPEVPQAILAHIAVTFYGDPRQRAAEVRQQTLERELGHAVEPELVADVPFFTNPTDCSGKNLKATLYMDSWQHPGSFNADGTPDLQGDSNWVKAESVSPPVIGCDGLQFSPEILAQLTTSQADSPAGLDFEMRLPQPETAGVPATPALKTATVTLPEGMTLDPSAGSGLQACSIAQIGWEGGTPLNFSPSPPQCPEASRVGSLELETPLISGILTGSIYLAAQNQNPFGSTLAGYIVVDDPVTGVVLKIAGELKTDPGTGRITGVFAESPQLPFSDLKLHFFGGPRGPLATPENCGTYTITSDLSPWSAPESGADAMPFASLPIGTGCVNGFAPAFAAGSTNLQAGAYTPFEVSFSRADTDQELAGATVNLPPGLSADITSVPQCPEPEANAGTCAEDTQIGTVQADAGPGPNPLPETGKAYLTGPYNGGPYGLSVVIPAIAGPFNFGNVVVRQSLRVNPTDAHVTDVSDPFPTILDVTGTNGQTIGIPIRLRDVDVDINRPGFTFNPTSCSSLQISGDFTSTLASTATLTTPFQVTNCATLKFAPKLSASTSAHTSKENGASLLVKVTYPSAAPGTYANVAKVKVDLPKQLPSRLTTLHHACLAATFEANPASCPAASIVGHARASVPELPLPLEGPAYFVSHGGEAFPSLTMVLKGNGVTIVLVGSTFIRNGITSSTFKTVPDAPVSSFELTLPDGKYSALGATTNLCAAKLAMPTAFVAQNGLEIHQTTIITTTGCPETPAQRLARALKTCRKKHNHARRASCARQARKSYLASSNKSKKK